jgi:hypothetical protein
MSFTPTNELVSDPYISLRDQQHAARLFADEQFALAPKSKFLFHVAFSLNKGALRTTDLVERFGSTIGMLVKSTDLPSYTVSTELLNQYNRKKVMQYQSKPGEITMKFHDDNTGIINQLWQNYYSYYYADFNSAGVPGAYSRTATKNSNYITQPYGLDNGSTEPFFNYIIIYQMARHEFVSYKLVNPIITFWNYNRVDYAQGQQTQEFDMKLQCEAVEYGLGVVGSDTIEGFGREHYDPTPSPLVGDTRIGVSSVLSSQNNQSNANNFLSNMIQTVNNYQNASQGTVPGNMGVINVDGANVTGTGNTLGINFPNSTVAQTSSPIIASQVNLGK